MRTDNPPFYGDRIDRKAKLAQRNHRNHQRDLDNDKYEVAEEGEDPQNYEASTGEMPITSNTKETL